MPSSPIEKARDAWCGDATGLHESFAAGWSAALDALTGDEVVEAAAKALYGFGMMQRGAAPFERAHWTVQKERRDQARAALAAARETLTDG